MKLSNATVVKLAPELGVSVQLACGNLVFGTLAPMNHPAGKVDLFATYHGANEYEVEATSEDGKAFLELVGG